MNQIILSLGGIAQINGVCLADATDEQLAAFLDGVKYIKGRQPLTVAEVRARQEQNKVEQTTREKQLRYLEARQYLASTDWYVIRLQETGKAIPAEVLDARQKARDLII